MPIVPQQFMALAPPAANTGLAILVNGYLRTTELADRSFNVHVGTHGNSLGTLDATFNNPTVKPTAGDLVVAFVNTTEIFEGSIKDVTVTELRGAYAIVKIGAQDNGPDTSLPTAAPWGLSDTPNGTTTHGYTYARKVTRTTEGGSPTTSVEAGIDEHGLWANMLVAVTSTTLGFAAQSFTIVDASLRFPNKNVPEYSFTLGTPLVSLAQLVSSGTMLDPGSITQTQIGDGAITTPKLNANAVISKVANFAGTVLINEDGVRIVGGALTVVNPGGTVIIDGTSDMFRILAAGSMSQAVTAPASAGNSVTLSALGTFVSTPAHMSFVAIDNLVTSNRGLGGVPLPTIGYVAGTSGGSPTNPAVTPSGFARIATSLNGSNQCVVNFTFWNANLGTTTWYGYYHVLAQVAI